MTRSITRLTLCCGLLLCLAACSSSPPSHFYRLTAAGAAPGSGGEPAIGVGPVEIPAFLDRSSLVYSRGGSGLVIEGSELWAEPLGEGVQRVVGLNLATLLDTQSLSYFPWDSRHAPTYGVKITLLDLDADGGNASLVADWLLYRPADGSVVARQISSYNKALPTSQPTAADLPPAYSDLLQQLSETIAAAVRADRSAAD